MMKSILGAILGSFLLTLSVFAASNTVSYTDLHNVKTVTFSFNNMRWEGNVPSAPTNDMTCSVTSKVVAGYLERVAVTSLSITGTFFRCTLKDSTGTDLLSGKGTSVATAPYNLQGTNMPTPFESALVFDVTHYATNTATNFGAVTIFYHE